jgi:hypothetical protein
MPAPPPGGQPRLVLVAVIFPRHGGGVPVAVAWLPRGRVAETPPEDEPAAETPSAVAG